VSTSTTPDTTPDESSLWQKTAPRAAFPALKSPFQTDVVVVGAGITGLTTALLLRREGRAVAVLEAERVGSGTTGGTSAHVTCVPDIRLARLVDRLGAGDATTYMKSAREALGLMQALAAGTAGPCDWATVPAYLLAETAEQEDELAREVEAARTLGLRASRTDRTPLPFPVAGAVLYPDQARFHPMKYLVGLARSVQDAGGQVFEHTRVRSFEEVGGFVELETDRGAVSARRLVLATHTPVGRSLVQAELVAYLSYLITLRLRDPVPDALFWDTSQPYHYMRRFRGEDEELLVLGGEDHKAGHPPEEAFAPFRRLEDYARARFPVEAVAHRWSAEYFEPADGLPYIGRSALAEGVFIATGYSGNGLVQGTLAARILTDSLQGRRTAVGDLLAATRIAPLGAARNVVAGTLDVAAHLVRDRLASAQGPLAAVPPGEGRLVEVSGRKLAVYRDEEGRLHALSPVCTHMGCLVGWNEVERTWDCPCHGGRYSPWGRVVAGPPLADLAPQRLD
jgi:glycine/D-amino acid oxidase-like deaminating enzyme/nitrite reductase/ring-hydroxylating ferredoxin subunit